MQSATAADSAKLLGHAECPGFPHSGIDWSGCSLYQANLTGARLNNATLSSALMNSAQLSQANLTGASMFHANLAGATLSGAIWSNTTCPDGTNSDTNGGSSCLGHL